MLCEPGRSQRWARPRAGQPILAKHQFHMAFFASFTWEFNTGSQAIVQEARDPAPPVVSTTLIFLWIIFLLLTIRTCTHVCICIKASFQHHISHEKKSMTRPIDRFLITSPCFRIVNCISQEELRVDRWFLPKLTQNYYRGSVPPYDYSTVALWLHQFLTLCKILVAKVQKIGRFLEKSAVLEGPGKSPNRC